MELRNEGINYTSLARRAALLARELESLVRLRVAGAAAGAAGAASAGAAGAGAGIRGAGIRGAGMLGAGARMRGGGVGGVESDSGVGADSDSDSSTNWSNSEANMSIRGERDMIAEEDDRR